MYFNGLLLGLSLLLFIPAKVKAEPTFTASPTTCVTLQQGRDCYATVQFQWWQPGNELVCLYLEQKQLQCWQGNRRVTFQYRFVDSASRTFYLKQGDTVLASHLLEISWVQHNQRSRQWRRF